MLPELEWESLESRSVKIQLTLLFQVVSNLVNIPASAYLTLGGRTRANHTKKLRQISSKSDAFNYSFFLRTISVWNSFEFFAGHCGRGPWLGILQAGVLHSYILS